MSSWPLVVSLHGAAQILVNLLSRVIREWAKESSRKVGPFKTARMEEAKFQDLEIRLGYPYVYLHLGYCEHLIVFSDMR